MDGLIAIARIVKPRGLKGEVAADILTDFPERFERLEKVTAVLPNGETAELKIEEHWFQQGRIVLKFAGHDSIESVEPLRAAEICVAESEAVEIDKDEYFDWQLIGSTIETVTGETLGTVTDVIRTGGTELLEVKGESRDLLIPFAETICVEVDIENKKIVVDPPDGLLDF